MSLLYHYFCIYIYIDIYIYIEREREREIDRKIDRGHIINHKNLPYRNTTLKVARPVSLSSNVVNIHLKFQTMDIMMFWL